MARIPDQDLERLKHELSLRAVDRGLGPQAHLARQGSRVSLSVIPYAAIP